MSGNIIIIWNARKYSIKTKPTQLINDLLLEGCKKAGQLNPQLYTLKYGSYTLDLSLPVRLARLPAGAKLMLIKREYEQKDIKVALQIIDLEKRLILSFPAQTTLWEILCQFEKITNPPINITKRSISIMSNDQPNHYYEMPTVRIMNKEFNNLETLTNITLYSQGIIEGSIVLQVKFEKTQMYFDQIMTLLQEKDKKLHKEDKKESKENLQPIEKTVKQIECKELFELHPQSPNPNLPEQKDSPELIQNRGILVFSEPTSSDLYSSKIDTTDEDYEMTLETAISYQNMLSAKAKGFNNQRSNIRQESEQNDNLKKKYEVKFKLPDRMQVIGTFDGNENVQALYDFMKHIIRYSEEPFCLYITPPPKYLLNMEKTLAYDLGFSPKTTVIFKWKETAHPHVKEQNILKDAYLNLQKDIYTIFGSQENI
ncbi:hypothetical protein PCANB_002715 [Pneumocystis canis]|nr:hypothetical protein PCANB_002715 [Pneumocystis canis]